MAYKINNLVGNFFYPVKDLYLLLHKLDNKEDAYNASGELLYGKNDGSQGETSIDWTVWKNSDGSAVTLSNGSWGEVYIPVSGIVSPVVLYSGSSLLRYSTNYTRYTNTYTPTVYIRTSSTVFSQMDSSLSYTLYTTPIVTSNQYIQIKLTRDVL